LVFVLCGRRTAHQAASLPAYSTGAAALDAVLLGLIPDFVEKSLAVSPCADIEYPRYGCAFGGALMKLNIALGIILAALSLAACAPSAPPAPVADDSGCVNPESGIIRPDTPGVIGVGLMGPILVKSLAVGVDPANPGTWGSLKWSKMDSWFTVHNFKGPFYLGPDETLTASAGHSAFVTIYFGCRLD